MIRQLNILPGRAANQDEVVRSLKARGFYCSGNPRTGCDVAAPAREQEAPPNVQDPEAVSRPQRLTRKQLRSLSEADFEKYCQVMRDEENNARG